MAGNSSTMPTGPTWTVNAVTPQVSVAGGTPIDGHLITFTTGNGNRSQVFVPGTVTDLAHVRSMIAERAAYVDGIASLTG